MLARMQSTGKDEIPQTAKKDTRLIFLNNFVLIVEKHLIPSCIVISLDQSTLKCILARHHTIAKKDLISVPFTGLRDKRSITGTYTVTLDGRFFPMQLFI